MGQMKYYESIPDEAIKISHHNLEEGLRLIKNQLDRSESDARKRMDTMKRKADNQHGIRVLEFEIQRDNAKRIALKDRLKAAEKTAKDANNEYLDKCVDITKEFNNSCIASEAMRQREINQIEKDYTDSSNLFLENFCGSLISLSERFLSNHPRFIEPVS